jgi:plastocyanin
MMRPNTTAIAILILVIIGLGCLGETSSPTTDDGTTAPTQGQDQSQGFSTPKKSAHYESNTPAHGATLAGVPINVVIDVNFDLRPPSSISIKKDGKEYSVGGTNIDSSGLAMRINMDPNSPDGIYTVVYDACWPDGSCHDGRFQFEIDSTIKETYTDLTGENEVTINIMDFSFQPQNIRIDKGTTVTWTNKDTTEHFVNTDSHPAHTYYPDQNSRGLKQGDTYTTVFNEPGVYPYHCSAHASTMKANILVE